MPTRRVAVGSSYLPSSGLAAGPLLVGAVVAAFAGDLPDDARELLPRLVREAREGLTVPRIALRYRLQTDTHGLDRSRHRILDYGGRQVLELDTHGAPDPQVLGAVMAASSLAPAARDRAFRTIDAALRRPGSLPEGLAIRRFAHGVRVAVPLKGRDGRIDHRAPIDPWSGIPVERRWAMEVFGLTAGSELRREEVLRRFRRLLRDAHPDHGAQPAGAAARIAELREARAQLLAAMTVANVRR